MIVAGVVAAFVFAGLCAGVRLFRGPSLADRIAALDVALVSAMGAIAADAVGRGDTTGLEVLVVLALVGFTATVAASRFIEQEGER